MFKNIFQTFYTKVIAALFYFLIVIITSKVLGADGKGVTSLFTTSVLVIILFNDIIGGSVLVYLIPRNPLLQLLLPSYAWALLSSTVLTGGFYLLGGIPDEYILHLWAVSLLQSLASIHLTILLAREKITQNNLLFLSRITIQLAALGIFYYVLKERTVEAFIWTLYLGNGLLVLLSSFSVFPSVQWQKISWIGAAKLVAGIGLVAQLANILQFMNYRLNFYLLDHFRDEAAVGIFSIALAFSEMIWMLSNSIGTILYARVANLKDREKAEQLSIRLMKFSFAGTVIFLIPPAVMPEVVYTWLFGPEFGEAREILWAMAAGIAAIGMTIIISSYFGGIGKYHINTISSGIGFVATLIAGFVLIPKYGMIGAGITASISYLASFLFSFVMFYRNTSFRLVDLGFSKADFLLPLQELRKQYAARKQES